MALNWKWIGFDIRKKFFTVRVAFWDIGTGFPEKLWISHLWRCSRPGWMGLWTPWSGESCPALGRTRWPLKVPSKPKYSMVPWFYECLFSIGHDLSLILIKPKEMGFSMYNIFSSALWGWYLWRGGASAHVSKMTEAILEAWNKAQLE